MKGTDHFKRTIQMYLEQRAEEDALFQVQDVYKRQGASESRVQGHALPRKILTTIKITTKIQK